MPTGLFKRKEVTNTKEDERKQFVVITKQVGRELCSVECQLWRPSDGRMKLHPLYHNSAGNRTGRRGLCGPGERRLALIYFRQAMLTQLRVPLLSCLTKQAKSAQIVFLQVFVVRAVPLELSLSYSCKHFSDSSSHRESCFLEIYTCEKYGQVSRRRNLPN